MGDLKVEMPSFKHFFKVWIIVSDFLSAVTLTPDKCSQHKQIPQYFLSAGYYCDSAGQQNETALCDEGYYCVEGAWRPDPNDNITGALCTPGHYCPRGTYDPEPCPAGYFSNATGNTAFEDCKLCSKGQ